jgi:predicted RNase H-like HicB family nuclease
MVTKKQYKKIDEYLDLPWTYTVEQAKDENNEKIYVVRVNELSGICTDAPSLDEAMELIKEPMTAAIEFYMENNQYVPEPITPIVVARPQSGRGNPGADYVITNRLLHGK